MISPCCWKKLFVVLFLVIAIPPASTWSRARNSGVGGPSPSRSRYSLLGIQSLPPKLLRQVREHCEVLEFCVMALDVWCRSFPSRPFFFVAPEDRGDQLHKSPASIWQLAEVMAVVKRTREAVQSSAFACALRAADSPRPLAFICNHRHLGSGMVRGWQQLQLKGDFFQCTGPLRHRCSCGKASSRTSWRLSWWTIFDGIVSAVPSRIATQRHVNDGSDNNDSRRAQRRARCAT